MFQTTVEAIFEDAALVIAVFGQTLDFGLLDRKRSSILIDAAAVEDADFDNRSDGSGRQAQEVSFTSAAFSPKMARRSFSSGVIGLSPLGVTLPTRISPGATSAPMCTIPPRQGA